MRPEPGIRRALDGTGLRRTLIGIAVAVGVVLLLAPIVIIFSYAFAQGLGVFVTNLLAPDTLHAIGLTLLTLIVVLPVNVAFGLAAAWAITRFRFRGKKLLVTILELPFSISPIVAGVIYLFLYGAQGLFGPWLAEHDIRLMFSIPAIFLVTIFVTSPFVARELITFMRNQGPDEEEAALSLGASAWRMFTMVTLPNIKWALLYGAILCGARSVGEFGAVSVVSGNIRGQTNTLPLQIELLYNDYNAAGAFAAAAILTLIALATIVIKTWLEGRGEA